MKRGRPKGRSRDTRSFGPLGDLIRKNRLDKGLGLLDVARACDCSVQFISNIEHGRAPLPWNKVPMIAKFLGIAAEELQAANLAVRSDFRSFVHSASGKRGRSPGLSGPQVLRSMNGMQSALAVSSAASSTIRDTQLQEILSRYQVASQESKQRFVKAALKLLSPGSNA